MPLRSARRSRRAEGNDPLTQQALLPGMVALPEYGDEHDFYSTPPSAVEAVLSFIPRLTESPWIVGEPAVGEGAILKALLPRVPNAKRVYAWEIHQGRADQCLASGFGTRQAVSTIRRDDFLAFPKTACAELALGRPWLWMLNPPYSKPYEGIGLDFVERCLEVAEREPGSVVAGLLPLDFATGVDRCKRVHDRWKGSLYPLRRRQDFGGPHGSGQRPVAWFIWDLLHPKNEYQVIG